MKQRYKYILVFLMGILFSSGIVYAANKISASDISFTSTNENFTATNVQEAMDELYNKSQSGNITKLDTINEKNKNITIDIKEYTTSYQNLTDDNFLINLTADSSALAGVRSSLDKDDARAYAEFYRPTLTYDSTTGILTVYSGYLQARAATDSGYHVQSSVTASIPFDLYMIG